MFMKLFQCFIL